MPAGRPLPLERQAGVSFLGEMVPSRKLVGIDIWGEVADLIAREIARSIAKSAGSALHGARIAGGASGMAEGERVTWIAVGGEAGDGKNCADCLDLHGTEMTMEQYEATKYTTACDGNCRCAFVPAGATDSAREIESISTSELEDNEGA